MTPSEELEKIYIQIGSNELEITDEISERIEELENTINPDRLQWCTRYEIETPEIGCGCGNPSMCWDCAAIRGGCPEDV